MASDGSSNGHEEDQRDDDDALSLPDAPLATTEADDLSQRDDETSSDGLGFMNEPLPRLPMNSSDDDLYQPGSEDEEEIDEDYESQDQVIKPEEDEDGDLLTRTPSPWAPYKRRAADTGPDDRAFKRARGSAFNHGYLTILNTDIEDAAAQYVPHGEEHLPASQVGMTHWTSVEKELFFEALARLGRDDLPGIARRIRTKGELEVRQYLRLLQDAAAARKRERKLTPACPEDFPAAVELGPRCAAALEAAADALAARQETYEESQERKRWGDSWLITPFNYRAIQSAPSAAADMPALGLFRVSAWLRLPERVFMNANFPENNWQHVAAADGGENPAIRATALEDFYSLAVSVTRRLVAASVHVARSRIRSRRDADPRRAPGSLVWGKDVEAAALSVGLGTDSRKFWAGCARRLRLDVYDDDGRDGEDDDDEDDSNGGDAGGAEEAGSEPMTYDEVEAALGGVHDGTDVSARPADESEEGEDLISLSDTPSLDELSDPDNNERQQQQQQQPLPGGHRGGPPSARPRDEDSQEHLGIDDDEDTLRADTRELLLHTAQPNPPTTRTRRAAERRIRNELRHAARAEAVDARARGLEERRLWDMLGRAARRRGRPDDEDEDEDEDDDDDDDDVRAKVKVPGPPPRMMASVEDMYPSAGGDWRENVRYVTEWEMTLREERGPGTQRRA